MEQQAIHEWTIPTYDEIPGPKFWQLRLNRAQFQQMLRRRTEEFRFHPVLSLNVVMRSQRGPQNVTVKIEVNGVPLREHNLRFFLRFKTWIFIHERREYKITYDTQDVLIWTHRHTVHGNRVFNDFGVTTTFYFMRRQFRLETAMIGRNGPIIHRLFFANNGEELPRQHEDIEPGVGVQVFPRR